MFAIILINFSWYQLSNVQLMNDILVKNHPYLFLWGEVSRVAKDYELVLKAFDSYGEDFKYLKVIDPSVDARIINSHGIKLLAQVAKEIGIKSGIETYKQLETGFKGTLPDIYPKGSEAINVETRFAKPDEKFKIIGTFRQDQTRTIKNIKRNNTMTAEMYDAK